MVFFELSVWVYKRILLNRLRTFCEYSHSSSPMSLSIWCFFWPLSVENQEALKMDSQCFFLDEDFVRDSVLDSSSCFCFLFRFSRWSDFKSSSMFLKSRLKTIFCCLETSFSFKLWLIVGSTRWYVLKIEAQFEESRC